MTSSTIDEKLITNLESFNSIEQYGDGVVILLKLLDNVIREPQNNKYRCIRLENKIIKDKLLCLNGIRELLSSIGFEEVCIDVITMTYGVLLPSTIIVVSIVVKSVLNIFHISPIELKAFDEVTTIPDSSQLIEYSYQFEGELRLPRNLIIAKLKKFRDVIRDRWELFQQNTKEEASPTEDDVLMDQAASSSNNINIERKNELHKIKIVEIIPKRPYHERTTFSRVIVNSIHTFYLFFSP